MIIENHTMEELRHYGVLGMKWGRTRAKASGADITEARRSVAFEKAKLNRQYDAQRNAKRGTAARAKQDAKTKSMELKYLKNPDRATALRMTRGEKVALAVVGLATGPLVAPLAVTTVGKSLVGRRIEQKQDQNKYDPK